MTRHDGAARQGPARARASLERPDPSHPRHRRAVQGDQRAGDQEGADAPRLDDRQPVLRGLHPHARLVRVRREAAVRRHGERRRPRDRACSKGETLVDTARNLEAMRIDMVVIRHGASGAAQLPRRAHRVERHQRRRRHARASHAGPARHAHAARPLRAARRAQGLHLRRRAALARRPLEHLGAARRWAPRWRVCGPRSLLPNAIDEFGVTVFERIEDAIEWADALNILRLQLERMHGGLHPLAARVQPRLRRVARAARARARGTSSSCIPGR